MLEKFFLDRAVRPDLDKEFVSIFDGWLGKESIHKLDEVTEGEWLKFNNFLRLLDRKYRLHIASLESHVSTEIHDIVPILESYAENKDKESVQFTKIVIPELDAVYTEEWDYTWILWHKNNGAVEALSPLIMGAGLFHWRDACTQNSN